MKNFNYKEVTELLEQMEQCVNRVKKLCSDLNKSWNIKNEEDLGLDSQLKF